MITVLSDAIIDIPPTVAVCPYCDSKLYAVCEAWSQEGDGTWAADEVHLDCTSEPAINSPNYKEWLKWHTDMPYVYWLPVDLKVKRWIDENYRFDLSDPVGDLNKWNEAVKDWQL